MSSLLAHQFIIYVAVIAYYTDYEAQVNYTEYYYTDFNDANQALAEMRDKEERNVGGSWTQTWPDAWEHSSGDMSAYVRAQVVNGPK